MVLVLDGWSTAVLLAIIFVITTTFFALKERKRHLTKSRLPRPPALPSLPIVGSLPFISFRDPAAFFLEKSKTLGKVFSLYAASRYDKLVVRSLAFEYLKRYYCDKLLQYCYFVVTSRPVGSGAVLFNNFCSRLHKRGTLLWGILSCCCNKKVNKHSSLQCKMQDSEVENFRWASRGQTKTNKMTVAFC